MDLRAVGDVFVNRFGEWIGFLENHAHPCAQLHHIHAGAVYVPAIQFDLAFDAGRRDRVVHTVERAQEGRLAATGWTDERRHILGRDIDRDLVDSLLVAIEDGNRLGAHLGFGLLEVVVDYGHQVFSNLLRR